MPEEYYNSFELSDYFLEKDLELANTLITAKKLNEECIRNLKTKT